MITFIHGNRIKYVKKLILIPHSSGNWHKLLNWIINKVNDCSMLIGAQWILQRKDINNLRWIFKSHVMQVPASPLRIIIRRINLFYFYSGSVYTHIKMTHFYLCDRWSVGVCKCTAIAVPETPLKGPAYDDVLRR